MTSKEEIGERIKSAISQKKRRQKEVASKVGISQTALSNYISGKNCPPADVLAKIATELEVSSDSLLGIEKEENMTDHSQPINNKPHIDTLGDVMRMLFYIDSLCGFSIDKIDQIEEESTYEDYEGVHTSFDIISPEHYSLYLDIHHNFSTINNYFREWKDIKELDLDTAIIKYTLLPAWLNKTVKDLDNYALDGSFIEDDGELPF